MKRTFPILSATLASAAILSGCANDSMQGDEPGYQGNEIRFAATTDYTRAGDITTNNLTTFNVYAYTGAGTDPTIFMDNVKVSKTQTNTWEYSPVQYWPAEGTVDFYAFSPASWVGKSSPLASVAYSTPAGGEDIVYAVSPDLKGNAGSANAQVIFNFRHALSKVSVKLSSTNTALKVNVTNVALANIASKGNFHFPGTSTSQSPEETTVGTWSDQNTPAPYLYHMSQSKDDIITLTSTPNDLSSFDLANKGAKYLIPQQLSWRSGGSGNDTYLTVMCSVYDAASGEKLWPNANTPKENVVEGSTFGDGLLKFPLSTSKFSEWMPGAHYIYNIVINSNEEMGTIEFGTPTVDTFVDVVTSYQ